MWPQTSFIDITHFKMNFMDLADLYVPASFSDNQKEKLSRKLFQS